VICLRADLSFLVAKLPLEMWGSHVAACSGLQIVADMRWYNTFWQALFCLVVLYRPTRPLDSLSIGG
jgi:hypothetical protein